MAQCRGPARRERCVKIVRAPVQLRIVRRDEAEARALAHEILDGARREAASIVAAAEASASRVSEDARRKGVEQGAEEAVAWLARARLEAERDGAALTESVTSLALEVARTVLGREASSGPEVVRDVAKRALARVRRARRLVLKVHPEDVSLVEQSVRTWLLPGMDPEALGVEGDAATERGGVVIESELGRIDARLDRQLDAIARALQTRG